MNRPRDQFTTVEGHQVRYWQVGREGPAVVCLHGIGCSVLEWEHSIHALATRHRVYALDLLGCGLTAKPGDNPDAIVQYYQTESNRRHEEYVKSPEYKKRQHEAQKAQRCQDLILKGAFMVVPEKMTLRDEEGWKKTVAANTDDYGGGVMSFVERWARLMEGRMANGDTLEACAEDASSLADNKGITGFMYGAAVSILSQVWVHGEQLRRWHNLKT